MNFKQEILRFHHLLDEEIKFVKRDESNDYVLTDGEYIKYESDHFIYIFSTEYEIRLTDSFPVIIKSKGEKYNATIINIEQTKIVLSLNKKIVGQLDKVFLSCNPAFLLEGLQERLLEVYKDNKGLSYDLIEYGQKDENISSVPNKELLHSMIQKNNITFIWGPPGSGKTTTLGELVKQFVNHGQRVLIVSQSNTAVDEAVLKILQHFQNTELLNQGKIIRYGYIQKEKLKKDFQNYCDIYTYVLNINIHLKNELEDINERIKEFTEGDESEEVIKLKDRKNEIYKLLSNERKRFINNAFVIGTTISKATIDELIYKQYYDIVLFDEASMAYIPQIIFAASLAHQKFICIGDMKQLAPISKVEELHEDIYDYLNMVEDNNIVSHQWLVMLNEQYRSHPTISKFVNKQFYFSRMSDGIKENKKLIEQIVESEPFKNHPMVLLDTSGFYASSCITLEYSRVNIVDACIAVITATEAYKKTKKSVGIITPYAAQARLIRKMLKDDLGSRKYDITCSTVHQFQGDEKDIIIFDTVESYPNEKLGKLTSDNKNNSVNRLINVAVTRARGKLIVIGNYSYWQEYAHLSNPFLKLMKSVEKENDSIVIGSNSLKKYIEKTRFGKIHIWDDDDNAAYAFIEDLRAAKENITIMLSKGSQINESCIEELKSIIKNEKNEVTIQIKTPVEQEQLVPLNNYSYIIKRDSLPISIIDNHIVWYGIPDMNRFYDLKKEKHVYEHNKIMVRVNGHHTAYTLDELLDFRNDLKILNKKENGIKLKEYVESKTCPHCGKQLWLVRNKHLYTHCSSCMKSEYLHYSIVNEFLEENNIRCPNDGGKLRAFVGPYGMLLRCSEHHNIAMDDFFEID